MSNGNCMFIEGRETQNAVRFENSLTSLSVHLRRAGFCIAASSEIAAPELWLDHANAYARHTPEAGRLEIVESLSVLAVGSGEEHANRTVWLGLPKEYAAQVLEDVDIEAWGEVTVDGVAANKLLVRTWGGVAVRNVAIGEYGLFKTVRQNVTVEGLDAPQDRKPQDHPSAELIALAGKVTVAGKAAWRLYGSEVELLDCVGPMHERAYSPVHRPTDGR